MAVNKKGEKKRLKWIIISASFFVAIILVAGYFYFHLQLNSRNHRPNGFPGGNFSQGENPFTEQTKNEITSFFESSPSSSEIEDYCNENSMYCFYYCREINSDNDFCNQLMNNTQPRGGMPPR